jgi:hypothetical protein
MRGTWLAGSLRVSHKVNSGSRRVTRSPCLLKTPRRPLFEADGPSRCQLRPRSGLSLSQKACRALIATAAVRAACDTRLRTGRASGARVLTAACASGLAPLRCEAQSVARRGV